MNKSGYETPRCPGSLKEAFTTYNPGTLRWLFSGRKVFHVLEGSPWGNMWEQSQIHGNHFGGQSWYRMVLNRNKPEPHPLGNYILKTVNEVNPTLKFPNEQAGNEHFCLQLARQVFEIDVIPNAMIFFENGQPAFIGKYDDHFPVKGNLLQGGFGTLAAQPESLIEIPANYTIFDLAGIINELVAAASVARERFFQYVLFSWLIANGHAYVNRFRLHKTERGDYMLAPLSDILCTRVHELSPEIAAPGGLYSGDRDSAQFREYGHYTRNEFTEFARRCGIRKNRYEKILDDMVAARYEAGKLIEKAFMPEEATNIIRYYFNERVLRLK